MGSVRAAPAFASVLGALALAACQTNPFQPAVATARTNGLELTTRNPELDLTIAKPAGAGARFCLSPETDAVPESSAKLALAGQGESADLEGGAGTALLGGIDPAVLIVREMLYRTCEFTLNHDLSEADALALYQHALDQAAAVAMRDAAPGTQPQSMAPPTP